jgi:hypothetical protein
MIIKNVIVSAASTEALQSMVADAFERAMFGVETGYLEPMGASRCSCGARSGERCGEACPEMARRRAEWLATHCGDRPTGRVLSRHRALDGFGIETHGQDAGGEVCGLAKGHAGVHEDYDRATQWSTQAAKCVRCGGGVAGHEHRSTCCTILENEAGQQYRRGLRRAEDAPLVALVNAVPSWADPVAWRSAVLALHEAFPSQEAHHLARDLAFLVTDVARDSLGPVVTTSARALAWRAYRRAITPHKAPQPERRRARGPVVVVDRGDDD